MKTVNPPEGHTEDESPRLVMNNKTVFVEVQQLSLQQLGFTEGRGVVAPGHHGSQHQHTAQHARYHQGPALVSQFLLQRGTAGSSGHLLLPGSHRHDLIHAEDLKAVRCVGREAALEEEVRTAVVNLNG